ncbi:helix-turn-helix transcriptional regulator [Hymenobacter sp. ASUV-10]|uniref:Helix-turn-helix transcriptional regulator n=1 Tax=Hymenobacter aranciens TaxID=3063996 RepID=A0ABT9BCE9_9BACT|nr:helix-turn-helix transcriptional regulator [Hymenobacter sp. ASUV-10]MDO7874228.1 helix-turn-helix transcriptional regulator [Hymenobacter sp. ASUV-10]
MRHFISTDTPIGAVRLYFGLTQQQLSMFLDVGKAFICHIESGRRDLSLALRARLWPLRRHLPPAATIRRPDDEPLPATAPPPDAKLLDFRRRECLHKAAGLRLELIPLTARAVYASRWQQVLPAVLADHAALTDPAEKEWADALRPWLETLPRRFRPSDTARHHLMRLQAEALETEAAALAELLAAAAPTS